MLSSQNITAYFPYLFCFLRINGILTMLPFFGDTPVPLKLRTVLAILLTVLIGSQLDFSHIGSVPLGLWDTLFFSFKELLVGVFLGFISRLAFDAMIMASSIVATQMGFGADKVFLPDYSGELDSFTALHRTLVILIFLSLNMHHLYILAIKRSFDIIRILQPKISGESLQTILTLCSEMFVVALQLSAPILIALLFATTALGILSRAVPQLNTFVISFPINFFLGLLVYIATIAFYPDWMELHFERLNENVSRIIKSLAIGV